MFSEAPSVALVSSLVVIVIIIIARFFEERLGVHTLSVVFRRADPYVQKVVTKMSIIILNVSLHIKRFVLVHMYHFSTDATKNIMRETVARRDALLDTLRGNRQTLARERAEEDVSPFLREISRIDRKEE